jgi:hypothetical protein
MNKVLNKEVKKTSDAKFARWQALFSNFDFDIEHVKGNENSIPNFLSREHLQVSMITSEHDQEREIISDPVQCMIIVTEWKEDQ